MKSKQQIKPKAFAYGKGAELAKDLKKSNKNNKAVATPVKNVIKEKVKQNAAAKQTPLKKTKKQASESDDDEDEDEDEEDVAIDSDDDAESDEEEDSTNGIENEDAEDDDEDEEDDDDEEEDDDEDEDDDDEEENVEDVKNGKAAVAATGGSDDENEDSDEEAPTQKPIEKSPKTQPLSNKINITSLPRDVAPERVVYVSDLPMKKNINAADLVEAFAKYGEITNVKLFHKQDKGAAFIAYVNAAEANAALAANGTVINGATISVVPKNEPKNAQLQDRAPNPSRMAVKNLAGGTTEDELKQYLADYEIEKIIVYKNKPGPPNHFCNGTIFFKDEANAKKAALEKHNGLFKGRNINILPHAYSNERYSAEHTVVIENKNGLNKIDNIDEFKAIFEQCGPVQFIDITCSPKVLAFVTFQKPQAVAKALKLSGSNKAGIDLEIVPYEKDIKKYIINVQNLKPFTTEDDLRAVFSKAGQIESVALKGHYANIKFADADGFCKSFLLNETEINGNPVFLEPFSIKKIQNSRPTFNNNRNQYHGGQQFKKQFGGKRPANGNQQSFKEGPNNKKKKFNIKNN